MLEITAPPVTSLLTTPDAVRADLKVSTDTDDSTLLPLIAQASAIIESWCGRPLALVGARETFRLHRHSPDICLSRYPVAQVTSVTIAGAELASGDYEVDRQCGAIYRLSRSGRYESWPAELIVVEYSAGFVLPPAENRTLPNDLERAAISLAARLWHARGRDVAVKAATYSDGASVTFGLGGATSGDGLPADIAAIVAPFRFPVVG